MSNYDTNRRAVATPTRRRLLATGALGTTALAGCIGDDEEPPDDVLVDDTADIDDIDVPDDDEVDIDPDEAFVEGQAFYLPIASNPAEMHFIWQTTSGIETELEEATEIWQLVQSSNLWGRWRGRHYWVGRDALGDTYPQVLEDFDIDGREIWLKIRDDATWSDGVDVTARDILANVAYRANPGPDGDWEYDPGAVHISGWVASFEAPDGLDGKEVSLFTPDTPAWEEVGGWEFDYTLALYWISGRWDSRLGVSFPAHWGPWDEYTDAAIEMLDEQVEDKPTTGDLIEPYISADDMEASREDPPPSTGAWMIDEIVGTEGVRLVPNPEFHHADRVNFDEVFAEWSEDETRTMASLAANRLDYASVSVTPETIDNFPDSLEELSAPSPRGHSITFDLSAMNATFRPPEVRQAILYALDTRAIAGNIHETATAPVNVPAGDTWSRPAVVSDEWVEENLVDYEQDLDRATELLEEVGWSREDETWYNANGQPLEVPYYTPSNNPVMEETISSQLNDFGFQISVQPLETATFSERTFGSEEPEQKFEDEYGGRGDGIMWSHHGTTNALAGFFGDLEHYYSRAIDTARDVRTLNFFDHEYQEEMIVDRWGEQDRVDGMPETWHDAYFQVPPLGEPDGELIDMPWFYIVRHIDRTPLERTDPLGELLDVEHYNAPHDEPHEENAEYYWKWNLWVTNWFLPGLPVALQADQHFLNRENWLWAGELTHLAEDAAVKWEYFAESAHLHDLLGEGLLQADPANPKRGAEVAPR